MQWTERRERFRALLGGANCIHPASVFDPVSARIAEDRGFELGMFAGSVASLVVLGAPDLTLITLTEFAEQSHRICRAGKLVSIEEGVGKMKAALSARRDPRLAIVGRTSAMAVTGMDDALKRARAYAAAGENAEQIFKFKE